MSKTTSALRKHALRHADAEEAVACEGTPLERRTVKRNRKAFVFLGLKDAMLKLKDSLAMAADLAAKSPGLLRVGANGWVKVDDASEVPLATLVKWIDESYALAAAAVKGKKKKKKKTKKKTPLKTESRPRRSRGRTPSTRARRAPARTRGVRRARRTSRSRS